MAVSEYYTDEELISQLRMFVDLDDVDIQACLSQVTELDENTLQVTILDKTFQFGKEICDVEEIE